MYKTGTMTFDDAGNPDPITIPVPCRSITLRQITSETQANYSVHAPAATSTGFTRYPAETQRFTAGEHNYFQAGDVPAYISAAAGTLTFGFICEDT